jgi:hypothetical protein
MSFLDQLRAARTTPQAVWLAFINTYRDACFDLYLFFEGKDDLSFYQPYFRQVWSSKGVFHGFNCEGKDAVIEIIAKVKPKLDYEWRGLFFVDKDLDDYCGCTRHTDAYLYETECYAIENFIASHTTLSVIWTDLLSLPLADPRFKDMSTAYNTAYQTWCDAMTSVMAWVIHLRRSNHRVVLNDVSMNNVISLDGDCKCTLRAGWAEHILAASNTRGVIYDAVAHNAVIAELKACEPKTYIRGKFDLWFFVSFIMKVIAALTEKVSGLPRVVCSVQITHKTAIDVLSPRLQPPDSLREFVNRVLPKMA